MEEMFTHDFYRFTCKKGNRRDFDCVSSVSIHSLFVPRACVHIFWSLIQFNQALLLPLSHSLCISLSYTLLIIHLFTLFYNCFEYDVLEWQWTCIGQLIDSHVTRSWIHFAIISITLISILIINYRLIQTYIIWSKCIRTRIDGQERQSGTENKINKWIVNYIKLHGTMTLFTYLGVASHFFNVSLIRFQYSNHFLWRFFSFLERFYWFMSWQKKFLHCDFLWHGTHTHAICTAHQLHSI